jgi:hypothetical protein
MNYAFVVGVAPIPQVGEAGNGGQEAYNGLSLCVAVPVETMANEIFSKVVPELPWPYAVQKNIMLTILYTVRKPSSTSWIFISRITLMLFVSVKNNKNVKKWKLNVVVVIATISTRLAVRRVRWRLGGSTEVPLAVTAVDPFLGMLGAEKSPMKRFSLDIGLLL